MAKAAPFSGMLGRYRVLEEIGSGGMGVVYRAHDERLERDVALKILPAGTVADDNARRRFRQEALALSRLNHPNIATIHDFDAQDGIDFLVTELIAGAGMDEKLARGALPEREIVSLGIQLAEGLVAAHIQGIVHRDLKPSNLRVTKDGRLKILDFGLAKLIHSVPEAVTQTATEDGGGTLPYMAPEQLRGEALDVRTDMWAVGAVLYEMATGRRPFEAKTSSALSGEILHRSVIAPTQLRPELSPRLEDIILKCLEKDPENRYQSANELIVDLRRISLSRTQPQTPFAVPKLRLWQLPIILAGLALIVVVVLLVIVRSKPVGAPALRYIQLTDFADSAAWPAISPDGKMLAFLRGEGSFGVKGQLYVKMLPDGDPVQLTHDELGKFYVRFSPDGARIAYTGADKWNWDTWTVPVLGGEPKRLLPNASGLTWSDKNHVVFSEITKGLYMKVVTAEESRAAQRDVYLPPQKEIAMAHFSAVSPDGKWLLVAEMDNHGWLPCRLLPFAGGATGTQVGPKDAKCTSMAFSPDGQWMYFSADAGTGTHLWRQKTSDGVPEQLTFGATTEENVSVTPDGRSLLASVGNAQSTIWFHDEHGDRQLTSQGYAFTPAVSPDGRNVYYLLRAGVSRSFVTGELWQADVATGAKERLFPGFLVTRFDIAPDGKRVVFAAVDKNDVSTLWLAPLDRRSPPKQLTMGNEYRPMFGPADEIYFIGSENGKDYVFAIEANGNRKKVVRDPVLYLINISPDQKWLVVWLESSGQESQTVMAYPVDGGPPQTICTGCGTGPANVGPPVVSWSRDQSTIYLYSQMRGMKKQDGIMAVPLPPDRALPLFPLGALSREEIAAKPGTRILDDSVFPGPNASLYVSMRIAEHRNIYRLDLP